jgi:hypothetical protein
VLHLFYESKVTADFIATPKSFKPKDRITDIKPMLAAKYAPLNSSGKGNQKAYLSEISQDLALYLLKHLGDAIVATQLLSEARSASDQAKEAAELEQLITNADIPPSVSLVVQLAISPEFNQSGAAWEHSCHAIPKNVKPQC